MLWRVIDGIAIVVLLASLWLCALSGIAVGLCGLYGVPLTVPLNCIVVFAVTAGVSVIIGLANAFLHDMIRGTK